jgi:hypothetical protein
MYSTGKWTPKQHQGCGGLLSEQWSVISGEEYICTVYGAKKNSKAEFQQEQEANALLISAAPELLEACKEAEKLIVVARQYFPHSIGDYYAKFQLEKTCATINKAIAAAENA